MRKNLVKNVTAGSPHQHQTSRGSSKTSSRSTPIPLLDVSHITARQHKANQSQRLACVGPSTSDESVRATMLLSAGQFNTRQTCSNKTAIHTISRPALSHHDTCLHYRRTHLIRAPPYSSFISMPSGDEPRPSTAAWKFDAKLDKSVSCNQ